MKRTPLTARNTSSLVIDSLCDQAKKENIAVVGLYLDFLSQQDQTITNVMGAIFKQLAGRKSIPNYIREAFQESKVEFGRRGLRPVNLMVMLKIAIASLPKIIICIDTLDECLPNCLPELLECLRDIIQVSPSTRTFLTGRPHVGDDVRRHFTKAVVIPISPKSDDVRNYVEMRLGRNAEPEAMSNDLWADIVWAIMEGVSDMYIRPFSSSTPSRMYTYQRLCEDSSLFC